MQRTKTIPNTHVSVGWNGGCWFLVIQEEAQDGFTESVKRGPVPKSLQDFELGLEILRFSSLESPAVGN